MKALVFHGSGRLRLEDKPEPTVREPTEAVVRILHTTICGTDLHILKGDVPTVAAGRTLGHEGVGVVERVGSAVANFVPGDRVVISCITACGRCANCRRQMYSHCERGGWLLGNRIDGTQAELVHVPHADMSLHKLPAGIDAAALVMLSDVLPTGFECGVLSGATKPGDAVAIVGAGPIGLAVLLTSRLYSPGMVIVCDPDERRLALARELGATHVVSMADGKGVAEVMRLTEGRGVDVAIEAVGIPESFDACQSMLAPGAHLANVGVHGKGAMLDLDKLWDRNVTITTRLVDTVSTPMLLRAVASGVLKPERLITHHFKLSEAMKAYEVFGQGRQTGALKVILSQG
jgi:alcohol dehydrogenase